MESRKEDDQATHHDVPSESQQRRMSLVLSDLCCDDVRMVSGQALVRAESAAPSQGSEVTRSPLLSQSAENTTVRLPPEKISIASDDLIIL